MEHQVSKKDCNADHCMAYSMILNTAWYGYMQFLSITTIVPSEAVSRRAWVDPRPNRERAGHYFFFSFFSFPSSPDLAFESESWKR